MAIGQSNDLARIIDHKLGQNRLPFKNFGGYDRFEFQEFRRRSFSSPLPHKSSVWSLFSKESLHNNRKEAVPENQLFEDGSGYDSRRSSLSRIPLRSSSSTDPIANASVAEGGQQEADLQNVMSEYQQQAAVAAVENTEVAVGAHAKKAGYIQCPICRRQLYCGPNDSLDAVVNRHIEEACTASTMVASP